MRGVIGAAFVVAVLATGAVLADDLTGKDHLLCSAGTVTACDELGDCAAAPAWVFNVPQFIEVDLRERTLNTTEASGEARSTPIKNLERTDGMTVLQGFENGRAFSFLITEETGLATVTVARDGIGVVVFASCTPLKK
jgi:hypothetical protein